VPVPPVDRIMRMLKRKPPADRVREQLFWLVDVIFACKTSGDPALLHHVNLVEQALGQLGEYLEEGNDLDLDEAITKIDKFSVVLRSAIAHGTGG
jgi:hypothetical protein